MAFQLPEVEFFIGNFMKIQTDGEHKNLDTDAIAKRWVNLVLAHIEAQNAKLKSRQTKIKRDPAIKDSDH